MPLVFFVLAFFSLIAGSSFFLTLSLFILGLMTMSMQRR